MMRIRWWRSTPTCTNSLARPLTLSAAATGTAGAACQCLMVLALDVLVFFNIPVRCTPGVLAQYAMPAVHAYMDAVRDAIWAPLGACYMLHITLQRGISCPQP